MFSSDSDIKDIAEADVEVTENIVAGVEAGDLIREGSKESINTLKNPSGSNTAQGTPRSRAGDSTHDESSLDVSSRLECSEDSGSRSGIIDENANPTLSSTPLRRGRDKTSTPLGTPAVGGKSRYPDELFSHR